MDYSSTKTQEEMIETKIVDDFLSEYHCNSIENALLGIEPSKNQYGQFETGASAMPWYYTSNLNGQPKLGNYMFSCWFIKDFESTSPGEYYLPLFIPILHKLSIDISQVWRMKANLFPRAQFIDHHLTHTDHHQQDDRGTLLYYVNTNDGFTVLERTKGRRKRNVKSVRNRLLMFDGGQPHHSTNCTNVNARCTVNINYQIK